MNPIINIILTVQIAIVIILTAISISAIKADNQIPEHININTLARFPNTFFSVSSNLLFSESTGDRHRHITKQIRKAITQQLVGIFTHFNIESHAAIIILDTI